MTATVRSGLLACIAAFFAAVRKAGPGQVYPGLYDRTELPTRSRASQPPSGLDPQQERASGLPDRQVAG
jgi:hypothetical protein